MEIEDHLILVGKIKKDQNKAKVSFSTPEVSSFSLPGTTDSMVQRLANEVLALKKKMS